MMAPINTRVVRRSAGSLGAYANVDAGRFCYREVQLAPMGAEGAKKMARRIAYDQDAPTGLTRRPRRQALSAAVPAEKLRKLRDRGRLPSPGAGPSAETRARRRHRTP